jgi:predicted DNA-binding WGR domain protein
MKLIRQTILVYREGRSDKVYEIDLCEVSPAAYVVNFRYGRRGSSLKEGVKTVSPVSRSEANEIFQDLVYSKTKKGYQELAAPAAEPASVHRTVTRAADPDARAQAVLNRLRSGAAVAKGGWPLERAIWRAGELKLRVAAPLLIDLIGSGDALRDYCIAWALGWCGDGQSISALGRLYTDTATPDFVRRIAGEALLKLSDEKNFSGFKSSVVAGLPRELRGLAETGPADTFTVTLLTYLNDAGHERYSVLEAVYLIDNPHVRPALRHILRTAPLRPNYFKRIRHIFKAAEYRHDAEIFGLIAYRFEKERAMFGHSYQSLAGENRYSYVSLPNGTHIAEGNKEIKKDAATIAYGSRTRTYLRKRTWRTLRRLGELGDVEYVRMAVGVLLPFSDADAQPVREGSVYQWNTNQTRQVWWDAFAPYWAFNHILYANSPRYFHKENTVAWRCRAPYKPGDAAPDVREEAFPELWERMPVGLLHLIAESNCRPVQHFAVKAMRACEQFCAELDREALLIILGRPYEETARFGFELLKARLRPEEPDHLLILAAADSVAPDVRAEAHRWIDERREHFLGDIDFMVALTTSPHTDTREFARRLLTSAAIPDAAARALIGRLIAHLAGLAAEDQRENARDIAQTLLQSFGLHLRTLGINVVLDLLAHPLMEVQEFGGNILLLHEVRPGALPEEIIITLVNSPYETVRGIGARLLGELSDDALLRRENLLVALSEHTLADLRNAIRPIIRRLSRSPGDPGFAQRLAQRLVRTLLRPEAQEGVHRSVVQLLQDEIGTGWIDEIDRELALQLVHAPSAPVQQLGGRLIETKARANAAWAESFDTDEIAALADSETRAVRQAAQTLFSLVLDRYRQAANPGGHLVEMARAVRLLDAKWDDARAFFFETFRTRFGEQDFTPGILVSVCDSVRADVQQFGRELVTKYFREESGQEYMLKLSEHPSSDLQIFVTNYLERYCADSPERLRELSHYFTTVLSRVNRSRVAKARVLEFLTVEAQKSVEAARVVADILTRQSATIAIGQKAAAIEAMLAISRRYPEISLPLDVKPAEVRRAV